MQRKNELFMPQYPDIFYRNPFVETVQPIDSVQVVDTVVGDSVVPSFITSGFHGTLTPLVRMSYEILQGWNLALLGLMLLLIVLNKQLYPRQFRQVLSVPSGVAHTNQLLREWSPLRSFIGFSFIISYIVVIALFVQKAFVVFSRDVTTYNGFDTFGVITGIVAAWVLLRLLILYFVGWLFKQKEVVTRQITVQLSISTLCFLLLQPVIWLVLYIPNSIFVWIGIGILFLAALTRMVLQWNETRVFSKLPSFYIFLYLCTLEIAPLILLLVAGMRYFAHNPVY